MKPTRLLRRAESDAKDERAEYIAARAHAAVLRAKAERARLEARLRAVDAFIPPPENP